MFCVRLDGPDDFDGWRTAARALALSGVAAGDVAWEINNTSSDLFGGTPLPAVDPAATFAVPRPFIDLARSAILHSDTERFALLYALLLHIRAQPGAMQDSADPRLRRLDRLAKAVRRDMHKMRAFVRFREMQGASASNDVPHFVAWFEPDHHIVRANAGFFLRRFANMRWSILTPALSVHWDGKTLREGPGAERGDAPSVDPVEDIWKSYYSAIFNPARLKIGAMLSEMPKKYWRNLPEAALIPDLIAGAQAREAAMIAASPTSPRTARYTSPNRDSSPSSADGMDSAPAAPLPKSAGASLSSR